jgi:acetyl esterase
MRTSVLRRLWLRQVLSLPFAVLKFLSGGGVMHVDGRTLDVQVNFLKRTFLTRPDHRLPLSLSSSLSVEAAREDWLDAALLMASGSQAKVKVEMIGSDGLSAIKGQIIRPQDLNPDRPLLVFFHEGGGVLGSPAISTAFASWLAHEAKCLIFLPEYRLAPEHRYPSGYEDAKAAFEWAQLNSVRLGAISAKVAVGGASLGANMAARLCLDLRREFKPLPYAQLLISPLLDLADTSLKSSPFAQSWPIGSRDLEMMIGKYAGALTALTEPALSPLRETLILSQPKTFVVSGGIDPLASQAEQFVKRLSEARTRVLYRRYDTLPCGFTLMAGVVDAAILATRDIAANWVELLNEPDRESQA